MVLMVLLEGWNGEKTQTQKLTKVAMKVMVELELKR